MVKKTIIDDSNSFEYLKLIEKSQANMEGIKNAPIVIQDNDITYLIDNALGIYSIVSNDENYLVRLDNNSISNIITDQKHYNIRLNHDIPVVSCENLEDGKLDQLFLEYACDNNARPSLHYYQSANNDTVAVELLFDVFNYIDTIDSYLMYLGNKKPNSIYLKYYKRLMGILKKMVKQRYLIDSNNENYLKVLLELGNKYSIVPYFYTNSLEEINYIIENIGFKTTIDDDLISMFTGRNELVKRLNSVIDIYNK